MPQENQISNSWKNAFLCQRAVYECIFVFHFLLFCTKNIKQWAEIEETTIYMKYIL